MAKLYFFLILLSTSLFAQSNHKIEINLPNTSGLEPIMGLGDEFYKLTKSAELQSVDDEDLDERIQKIITNRLNSFNQNNQYGISLAFYTPKLGIRTATAGYSDIVTKDPITPDMTFQVASITKWMVSTLIFKLQEEGKLGINDEIGDYLPDYPNIDNTYTIAELLTHSTDTYDYLNRNIDFFLSMYSSPESIPTLDQVLNNLPAYQRQNPQSSEYSNTNFVLLAKIIESVTGNDYYEYLKTTIIQPLDLEDTYSGRFPADNDNPVMEGWFNDAYWRTGLSRMSSVDLSKLMELSYGLGDMYSTPTDLVKFAKAWMDEELLNSENLEQLSKEQARILNDPSDPFDDQLLSYGLFLDNLGGSKQAVFHSGSLLGYTSILYTVPEDDFIIAFCINSNNAGFQFYPNRMQSIISHLIFDIYEIDSGINPELEIHSIDFTEIQGNNNGVIEPGERIELNLVARDVSGSTIFREFVDYNLSSNDVKWFSNSKNGSFMDTGYNFLDDYDGQFIFDVPNDIDKDFLKFNLQISDSFDSQTLNKEFKLPINSSKTSAYFDGSYVNTIQVPLSDLEAPDAITYETWLNIGDISTLPSGLSCITWIGYTTAVLVFNGGGAPILVVQIQQENGRSGQITISDPDLQFNKWSHIAFTYNENNELIFYLNGEEVDYNISEGSFTEKPSENYPQIMTIGSMPTIADANQIPNFLGNIDEVRYWGRALSKEEINKSMNELPDDKSNLIVNMDFDGVLSSYHPLNESSEQSANFFAYYGENTSYEPGSFVSSIKENENFANSLAVFPNPTNGYINLELSSMPDNVSLFDLHGIKIKDFSSDKLVFTGNSIRINVQDLATGTYLIETKTGEVRNSKMFVKK